MIQYIDRKISNICSGEIMKTEKEMPYISDGIISSVYCVHLKIEKSYMSSNLYHYHDDIEVLYSINTDDEVCINGKYYNFSSGDLIVINPETPHIVFHKENSEYICIKFSPRILYADEASFFRFRYILPFISKDAQAGIYKKNEIINLEVDSTVKEIAEEWKKKLPGYELFIKSRITGLFGRLIRNFSERSENGCLPEVMKKAFSYIAENYSSVNEKEVANFCAMSYSHFSRIFKKTANCSFNEYLLSLKLKEAEKLLISSDKTITEIAQETGFSTSSHFIINFKKIKGITPKQYKNKIVDKR